MTVFRPLFPSVLHQLSRRIQTVNVIFATSNSRIRAMSSAFASIANEVAFDIVSATHAEVNAAKRKEISRTFICTLFL